MSEARDPATALRDLVEVVARLRGPEGCPWDRAQTHRSLIPYLLEEAYEAAAAVSDGSTEEIRDELGDVLLQVLLHSQIEAEAGHFGIGEVADTLRDKLVRRHPHVFGGGQAGAADEVRLRWEEIKDHEGRPTRNPRIPALIRAVKFVEIEQAAGRPVAVGTWIRLPDGAPPTERAIGEILLEVVALARRHGLDAELALEKRLAGEGDG